MRGFIPSSRYFAATDRYGNPGFSPAQLATATEAQRLAADRVLLEAGDLAAIPASNAQISRAVGCRLAAAAPSGLGAALRVPSRGLLVEPHGARSDVTVAARRFAAGTQPVRLPSGSAAVLLKPGATESEPPWFVFVDGATVCSPR